MFRSSQVLVVTFLKRRGEGENGEGGKKEEIKNSRKKDYDRGLVVTFFSSVKLRRGREGGEEKHDDEVMVEVLS